MIVVGVVLVLLDWRLYESVIACESVLVVTGATVLVLVVVTFACGIAAGAGA